MTNTSADGGYLLPDPAGPVAPLEDAALQDFLQSVVVGTTGLPGTLVRPRWQPEPPDLPDYGTTWAAIGEISRIVEMYAFEWHYCENDTGGPGHDLQVRNEEIELLVTFYGPSASTYAGLLRDGIQVGQNREKLLLAGFGLINTGDPVTVPELIKERWWYRVDQPFLVRRQIQRKYNVLNLLSAPTTLSAQGSQSTITKEIDP